LITCISNNDRLPRPLNIYKTLFERSQFYNRLSSMTLRSFNSA
jgi:hypothetical protein